MCSSIVVVAASACGRGPGQFGCSSTCLSLGARRLDKARLGTAPQFYSGNKIRILNRRRRDQLLDVVVPLRNMRRVRFVRRARVRRVF